MTTISKTRRQIKMKNLIRQRMRIDLKNIPAKFRLSIRCETTKLKLSLKRSP